MRKYLLVLLFSPMLAMGQPRLESGHMNLLLGLSLNNTITGVEHNDQYSNHPTSAYVFPEFHILGDLNLTKRNDLLFRLEGTATFIQVKYSLQGANGYSSYVSDYKVNEFAIGINPQLLYQFASINTTRFYAGAGISVSLLSVGNHVTETQSIQGGPYYQSGTDYDSASWSSFAANLKFGCFIAERFDLYIDYNKPFAVVSGLVNFSSYYPSRTTNQNIFKVGINYRLSTLSGKRPTPVGKNRAS